MLAPTPFASQTFSATKLLAPQIKMLLKSYLQESASSNKH
jgi:hypothetical protein